MKICLIAEGSYPYVVGGVSNWIQMLITQMPEHEFIIYCIGAEERLKGKYKYNIPSNVSFVSEIFLDSILKDEGIFGKKYSISKEQKESVEKLITGETLNFHEIFSMLENKKIKNVSDFLMSRDFFNIVMSAYEKKYAFMPFTEFFWTVRSILLPLFYILKQDIPKADLYHSVSTGYAGVVASAASIKYNKPYILTEHGIYSREREEEIIKSTFVKSYFKDMWIDFFYNLSMCSYSTAREVITLFEKNKDIEIELGCNDHKIKIIPNGVNINDYENIANNENHSETINIGAVLRVVPIKDVKTMLESFVIVCREIKNCNFYIIGPTDEDEDYYKECLELVKSLELKNIIFTGRVNVKDYLSKIDIMVLSSISEGQPLAILEGMACRKPFVTTDVGGCSELIYGNNDEYGDAGFVVPVMNYVKMGQSIIELCKSQKQRELMGENGFKRIANYYTLEKFINLYKNIYKAYEDKK